MAATVEVAAVMLGWAMWTAVCVCQAGNAHCNPAKMTRSVDWGRLQGKWYLKMQARSGSSTTGVDNLYTAATLNLSVTFHQGRPQVVINASSHHADDPSCLTTVPETIVPSGSLVVFPRERRINNYFFATDYQSVLAVWSHWPTYVEILGIYDRHRHGFPNGAAIYSDLLRVCGFHGSNPFSGVYNLLLTYDYAPDCM